MMAGMKFSRSAGPFLVMPCCEITHNKGAYDVGWRSNHGRKDANLLFYVSIVLRVRVFL
jgi:hypothetical protein